MSVYGSPSSIYGTSDYGTTVPRSTEAVALTFSDAFGSPLPAEAFVTIFPELSDASPASAVGSGFVGVASGFSAQLFEGQSYRAQFTGTRAPQSVAFFQVASGATTVVCSDYASPSLATNGFAAAIIDLLVRGFQNHEATTPGGNAFALYIAPVAAALAAVEMQLRAIIAGLRLDSATGYFLTTWVADFFGNGLPQLPGESEAQYIERVEAAFQQQYTRLYDLRAIVAAFYVGVLDGSTAQRVFDRHSDPQRAAYYGLLPGQVAIASYFPAVAQEGWFLGGGALGTNTFLSNPFAFTVSASPPYPILDAQLLASKAEGTQLVYISTHGEPFAGSS